MCEWKVSNFFNLLVGKFINCRKTNFIIKLATKKSAKFKPYVAKKDSIAKFISKDTFESVSRLIDLKSAKFGNEEILPSKFRFIDNK